MSVMDSYRKIKVIVVDDMPNMRKTIKNMLRAIGFERIVEAADGQSAHEKILVGGYGLVISDWNMPGMSGIEFLQKVRENNDLKAVPFLMITAEINEEQIAHAAETQVDGYILKPFTVATLKQKVGSVLERKSRPSPIDAIVNLCSAMVESGQSAKALEALKLALKKYPKSARLMVAIGEALEDQGDDSAAKYFEKAIEVNPMFVRASQRLGEFHTARDDLRKALVHFEKAARISPNDSGRQLAMGKLYLKTGSPDKARQAFGAATKVDGAQTDIHREIGEAYMSAGMEDQAISAFKRAISADPNVINLYNRLGIALRRKGRHTEAIEEYKKALEVAPDDEALYYNMARAYISTGDKNGARTAIAQALKIDPDFEEAKNLLTTLQE